jgi:hypothetical protein
MKNTILILGDSWGCGEWNGINVIHGGLSWYLSDAGYSVINLSRPGGSNYDSWIRLENFLLVNFVSNIERIFVFQTEWDRELMLDRVDLVDKILNPSAIFRGIGFEYVDPDKDIASQIDIRTANGLGTLLQLNFYHQLSRIAVKYNVTIDLIGGCADVLKFDNIPNVRIACQSFTNLLINNNHLTTEPVGTLFHSEPVINFIKKHLEHNTDLTELLYHLQLAERREETWKNHSNFFYPDGVHANRLAHRILYEFLRD